MSQFQRSNSCLSDSVALLVPHQAGNSRRPSAISVGSVGQGKSLAPPGHHKAYLIRQRSTGEEVVVTMSPVRSPVVGARTVVSQVPQFLASGQFVTPLITSNKKKRSSLDDENILYNSLMTPADYSRRYSEMVGAEEVIAANRLQKMYQQYRKQAHANSDETMMHQNERLNDWLMEKENRRRRKSCAVTAAESSGKRVSSAGHLTTPCRRNRAERAHSFGIIVPENAAVCTFYCLLL